MSELIFIVEEAPEGGYIARALGQSIFTEADTPAELPGKVREAVRCHLKKAWPQRSSALGGRLLGHVPAGKHQDGGMTPQDTRQGFGPLDAQIDGVVFNG